MSCKQYILTLFFVTLLCWPAAHAVAESTKPKVSLNKVPGTTAAIITVDGEINAPPAALRAVLCDYETYYRFSRTSEKSAVLSDAEVKELQHQKPKHRDDVEPRVVPGRNRSACESRTYVLTLLDYPFPISDGWSLAEYAGAFSGSTFTLTFTNVMGSDKGAGEYRVTPISSERARLVMVANADMGVQLPSFLVQWALDTQLPRLFREIEREARLRAPDAD